MCICQESSSEDHDIHLSGILTNSSKWSFQSITKEGIWPCILLSLLCYDFLLPSPALNNGWWHSSFHNQKRLVIRFYLFCLVLKSFISNISLCTKPCPFIQELHFYFGKAQANPSFKLLLKIQIIRWYITKQQSTIILTRIEGLYYHHRSEQWHSASHFAWNIKFTPLKIGFIINPVTCIIHSKQETILEYVKPVLKSMTP